MRTVGANGECAGDLRSAGGLVPSIHNALYRYSYQLSIYICEVLVPNGDLPGIGNPKTQSPTTRLGHPDLALELSSGPPAEETREKGEESEKGEEKE